jgi:RNA polymerase sigma factor (sigma-70 family)
MLRATSDGAQRPGSGWSRTRLKSGAIAGAGGWCAPAAAVTATREISPHAAATFIASTTEAYPERFANPGPCPLGAPCYARRCPSAGWFESRRAQPSAVNQIAFRGKHAEMDESGRADPAVFQRSVEEPHLFTIIFDRHYRTVHGYLSRRVGRTAADDLAAETFIRAFERRSAYDATVERALPWLLGIAVNLVAHHRRREARQFRALAAAAPKPSQARDEEGLDAVATERLVAGLKELGEHDRETLLLYAWAELRYEEIADALRIPVGTVRSRLNRARRKLRKALEEPEETEDVVHMQWEGAKGA